MKLYSGTSHVFLDVHILEHGSLALFQCVMKYLPIKFTAFALLNGDATLLVALKK